MPYLGVRKFGCRDGDGVMTVGTLRYLYERRHGAGGKKELQMSKNTNNTNRRPGCQCGETCSCGAGCTCGTR